MTVEATRFAGRSASTLASWPASFSCRCLIRRRPSLFSLCSLSVAAGRSSSPVDSNRAAADTVSRNRRYDSSARIPHLNSTRIPPRNRSNEPTLMLPMAPVRDTCVPPQADRSNPSTSTILSLPLRRGSFRKGRFAASLSSTNRTDTGRSSQTTRLATSSAAAI
jgi:hypothetical protein